MAASKHTDITTELDCSRNLLGARLSPRVKAWIVACVENPTEATWDEAYSIVVGSDGWTTLWQAVLKVRPSFPRIGPTRERGVIIPGYGWKEIPDKATLVVAIRYATDRLILIPTLVPARPKRRRRPHSRPRSDL